MSDDAIRGALLAAREYLRPCAQGEPTYGHYLGGDPRNFFPDEESCSPEEIGRHKTACAAWERGERPVSEPHRHEAQEIEGKLVIVSYPGAFGLGVYHMRDEEAEDVLAQVEAALALLTD